MYFNPFSVASLLDKNIFQLSEKPWKSLFELKLKSKSKVKLNFRGKKLTIFFHGFIFREMVLNDSLVPKEGEFAWTNFKQSQVITFMFRNLLYLMGPNFI